MQLNFCVLSHVMIERVNDANEAMHRSQ